MSEADQTPLTLGFYNSACRSNAIFKSLFLS